MQTLPPRLILFSDFENDWEKYNDNLYKIYLRDIVGANLTFKGFPIRYQYRPPTNGKGYGYWHLISEGPNEEDRTPDFRRCERILWIRWLIEEAEINSEIRYYESRRKSNIHIVIWHYVRHYIVILAKHSDYYLLRTAYPVNSNRERTFEKEWNSSTLKG